MEGWEGEEEFIHDRTRERCDSVAMGPTNCDCDILSRTTPGEGGRWARTSGGCRVKVEEVGSRWMWRRRTGRRGGVDL